MLWWGPPDQLQHRQLPVQAQFRGDMIPDCLFTRKVPNFRVLYPNRIIGVGPTKRQTACANRP
jgi:hypothetical protein